MLSKHLGTILEIQELCILNWNAKDLKDSPVAKYLKNNNATDKGYRHNYLQHYGIHVTIFSFY